LAEGPGPPASALNRAEGRIRRMSFLGNILRYVVDVGGAEITVDVQNAGSRPLGQGEPVALAWAVADSLALEG
jgi:putative spermidine/putrescine transport system ATP-binding protein